MRRRPRWRSAGWGTRAAAQGMAGRLPEEGGKGAGARGSLVWSPCGYPQGKGGSQAWLGFDAQPAVRLFQQMLDDGQAQTGAFAGLFGGVIGLEDALDGDGGDAGAVVGDADFHQGRLVLEGKAAGEAGMIGLLHESGGYGLLDELGGNADLVGHVGGLEGVDDEVEQNLD